MKHLKFIFPLVIVIAGLGVSMVLVKAGREAGQREPETVAPLVRALSVSPQEHKYTVLSQGTVEARTEINLVAEVGGRIIEVSPSLVAGGFFSKGDLLARVEPVDYRAGVAQAEAALSQAEVALEMEQAQAEVSRNEWKDLGLEKSNPLATRELQVKEAEARVGAAQAALDKARKDLDRTELRAPFEGRVRRKFVDIGQYLVPGTQVATIYAVDYVEIRLPISGEDVGFADFPRGRAGERSGGPRVDITAEFAGETRTWPGQIVRTEGALDPRSRMLYAVARVKKPYGEGSDETPLEIGLFAKAAIYGKSVPDVYLVPRSALRNESRLVLIDDDNTLHYRDVRILRLEDDTAVVGSGLSPGDRVLISPMNSIVEGMPVRVAGSENSEIPPEVGS